VICAQIMRKKVLLPDWSQKIRQVEKRSILTEFGMSSFIAAANLVLRLGIATTALVGILLLVQEQTDLLTFFLLFTGGDQAL